MNKAQRKLARKASSAAIERRFPKGGNDPLNRTLTLGNSFRSINSLDFKVVKTGSMLRK